MVFDSIIVTIYFNTSEPSQSFNLSVYIFLVLVFVITNYFLLRYSMQYVLSKRKSKLWIYSWAIVICQTLICVTLFFPILQLFLFKSYSILSVETAAYLAHVLALISLAILAYQFINWFRSNHKFIIFMYACALCIFIVSVITSITFFNFKFSSYVEEIKLRSIKSSILDSPSFGSSIKFLILFYDYLTIASFVCAWIPSVILLRTYSRSGTIKFSFLIILPLIYFLIPFISTHLGFFDNLRLEFGRQFNLVYSIIFAPYKQVGAILFGLVFLTTASKIKRKNLKLLLSISGIGLTVFFASTVTHGLKYIVAPPFGIVTVSFMGLGSFMLLIGITTSTRELAKDFRIRSEIQKSIGEQFSFLKTLSSTEREQSLQKTVKRIVSKTALSTDSESEEIAQEEDYKTMVKEVLDELNSRRQKINTHDK